MFCVQPAGVSAWLIRRITVLTLAVAGCGWVFPAAAADLDLALVLAVDVSRSVDDAEYDLQIAGISDAFEDPLVLDAMRAAVPNGMAVAVMQWAGQGEQEVSVPWTIVRGDADAAALAASIRKAPRPVTFGGTALAEALARATLLAAASPAAGRRVIDVSGDGTDNRDRSPVPARDAALSLGVIVNGLAVSNDQPYLAGYFRQQVTGGPGAFVVHVRDYDDFGEAIRAKLIREIGTLIVGSLEPEILPIEVAMQPAGLARPALPR